MDEKSNQRNSEISCKTNTESKRPPPPPAHIARGARQRGAQLQEAVCSWARRWVTVSDRALAALYPGRPRLGADMAKRGLLEAFKVPAGEYCEDGRTLYKLTEGGEHLAEQVLPPEVCLIELPERMPWRSMQHLLDLQRYAAKLGMLPADPHWRTEPELRALSGDADVLVPDLRGMDHPPDDPEGPLGEWWIEWERNSKKDVPLDYWTQRLARRVALAQAQADPRSPQYVPQPEQRKPLINRITVIVTTETQVQRYQRAFARPHADMRRRDPVTRKATVRPSEPRQPIDAILRPYVEVIRPLDLETVSLRTTEEQRLAVLASRHIPSL